MTGTHMAFTTYTKIGKWEELLQYCNHQTIAGEKGSHIEKTTAVSTAGTVNTVVPYTHPRGKGNRSGAG